jgi:hypothetical protein
MSFRITDEERRLIRDAAPPPPQRPAPPPPEEQRIRYPSSDTRIPTLRITGRDPRRIIRTADPPPPQRPAPPPPLPPPPPPLRRAPPPQLPSWLRPSTSSPPEELRSASGSVDSVVGEDTNPFSFMFIALGKTSECDVRIIMSDLNLGTIDSIDTLNMPDGRRKFFVHYSNFTARDLQARLVDVERRQREGEVDVRPPRIVYGEKSDGSPVYWQIYKALALTKRTELTSRPKTTFKPRLEGGKSKRKKYKGKSKTKRRK